MRALLAGVIGLGYLVLSAACGDDGGESGLPSNSSIATATKAAANTTPVPRTPSTAGTAGGPEPILAKPAAQFSLLLSDLKDGIYKVHEPNTYIVNAARFSLLGQFSSGINAAALIQSWKFVEGWNVQYDPQGLLAAVATGSYYLTLETYLFEGTDGAKSAYQSFETQYSSVPGSTREATAPLANQSSGWSYISGTVGRSDLANVFHRFLFRRGNMVAVVQTNGAGPFMTIDIARNYAVIIDEEALGKRPANLPTPIATRASAVPTQ